MESAIVRIASAGSTKQRAMRTVNLEGPEDGKAVLFLPHLRLAEGRSARPIQPGARRRRTYAEAPARHLIEETPKRTRMALNLIYGPPNSGRAGVIRRRFTECLDRDPVLVVPTVDDVYAFERELCESGASLGGAVMTLSALFRAVATAAGSPPAAELTPAQRLRAISVAA